MGRTSSDMKRLNKPKQSDRAKPCLRPTHLTMKRTHTSFMRLNPKLLFGCLLFAALCEPALAKLNVLATTPDLASIAKAIGGDLIDLTVLAKPTEDPHFVDAKPSLILKLNRADVVIEGGAELEIGWLPRLLDESRNVKLAE